MAGLVDEVAQRFEAVERQVLMLADIIGLLDERIIEGGPEAFQTDGNPLQAWEVWRRCRAADVPVPEPILKYLDGVAEALLALSAQPPERVGPAVQKALGLQVGGGRGSDLSRYREAERNVDLAIEVQGLLDGVPAKGRRPSQETAFAEVAERHGLSAELVRRAWRQHRRR